MSVITGTLGGVTLPILEVPFLETPLENAVDITTLGQNTYTDFVSQKRQWELNWTVLTEAQYNALKAVYNTQFSTGVYPTFVVPYYSINTQVRMYINDKNIQSNGCDIVGVKITLIEKQAIAEVS